MVCEIAAPLKGQKARFESIYTMDVWHGVCVTRVLKLFSGHVCVYSSDLRSRHLLWIEFNLNVSNEKMEWWMVYTIDDLRKLCRNSFTHDTEFSHQNLAIDCAYSETSFRQHWLMALSLFSCIAELCGYFVKDTSLSRRLTLLNHPSCGGPSSRSGRGARA